MRARKVCISWRVFCHIFFCILSVVLQLPISRPHKTLRLCGEVSVSCSGLGHTVPVYHDLCQSLLVTTLVCHWRSSFGLLMSVCHSASQHKIILLVDGGQTYELYDLPNSMWLLNDVIDIINARDTFSVKDGCIWKFDLPFDLHYLFQTDCVLMIKFPCVTPACCWSFTCIQQNRTYSSTVHFQLRL